MAQAVPTSAAPAPAAAKPPAAAPTVPAAASAPSPSNRCACRRLRRRGEALGGFCLRQLLRGKLLDVLRALALHLRRPLPRSLQQGLHFGGSPDDLRGRDLVWRRAEALRAPGDPQRPVQPVLAAPQGVPGSALREALASCCGSRRASGDDRLRRLDARLPQPASERRGLGAFKPSFLSACPGSMPPSSESGRKEAW